MKKMLYSYAFVAAILAELGTICPLEANTVAPSHEITVKSDLSGRFASPDGKYVLYREIGDAHDIDKFAIALLSKDRKRELYHRNLVTHLDSVYGFAWLPNQPHTLVFAARRYRGGPPFIATWSGDKRFKTLVAGNLPQNADPDAEYFEILSVSAGGSYIVYRHYDGTTDEKMKAIDRTEKIRHRFYLAKRTV